MKPAYPPKATPKQAHLLHQARKRQAAARFKPGQAGGEVITHDLVVSIGTVQLLCNGG